MAPELPPRVVSDRYRDPLDVVWIGTAGALGLTVRWSSEVYASSDGQGVLTLGAPETLDADDCVAQMIFHELCHWIVNGAEAVRSIDWGFPPMEEVDWREFVTLRVQAELARCHGLERLLAPTTDARAYYDAVVAAPLQPLDGSERERAITSMARERVAASTEDPWGPPLARALRATAQIRAAAQPWADSDSLLR